MRDDVFGLETLRPLFYLEFHLLSFVQCFIAVRLDSGEMNENVFAGLSLNESVPFGGIKPFDCTLFFAQLRYSSAYGIASNRKGRFLARTFSAYKRGRMLPQNSRPVQRRVAHFQTASPGS
jgi:hypothetical protein